MDEFESPVVKEIPVYISKTLSNKLVIYQYPLDNGLRPENSRVIECNMKDDLEVMMDLERDTTSANYNTSKGEQMAINADGSKNSEDVLFPRKLMDKQMMVSKMVPGENIAIGIYQDGELHLTPAAGVALLRPSFRYLDAGDKRAKQQAKEKGEGDMSEEDEEMQQVTVKFARQESDRAKKAREKSFSYLSKESAKKIWHRVDYFDPSSSRAELETSKLFCSRTGERVTETRPEKFELVEGLMKDGSNNSRNAAHGLPLTNLSFIPTLLERVRSILSEARVAELATLHRLLGEPNGSSDIQDRIKVVQHVAVLVQGCWVVQSDVVIGKDSAPNGVPSNLARCARDYMLYLFTRNRSVTRRKVMEVVKLPGDVVKSMLEEFAILNSAKEWEFSLPTDLHFIANFPEVVQRQQAKWELRLEQLLAGLRPPEAGATPQARHRRRSGRDSFSSDTEAGDVRRNFPAQKMRRTTKLSESKATDVPS